MFNFYQVFKHWKISNKFIQEGEIPLQTNILTIEIGSMITIDWRYLYGESFYYVGKVKGRKIIEDTCIIKKSLSTSEHSLYKEITSVLVKILPSLIDKIYKEKIRVSYAEQFFLNTLRENAEYYHKTFIAFDMLEDGMSLIQGIIKEKLSDTDKIHYRLPLYYFYLESEIFAQQSYEKVTELITEEIMYYLTQNDCSLANSLMEKMLA